ncbi:MAG: hypothetical protein A3K06_00055 [Candidatus Doudnabacteria bacterium RIFCSPHIGHO2_01_52_17]|uniref:Right handed beta helix domain-containing protein n=1 Tax=Candidatus Doudnabacteria bacterium RIFCSPHIGHO2_01_52_17 TaxID=1817820 RepID=A0A1F5NAC5_9BACT|nr:MAG: hypothetical protein A3K06_00055 [Candidatus Doudnabacteria bacterium RIFCSPHIGHO2_01_52_17]
MRKFFSFFAVALLLFPNTAFAKIWFVPGDFATIADAVTSTDVVNGDEIVLRSGNHAGVLLSKSLKFRGAGQAVINAGPTHGSGLSQGFRLLAGSDGSEFQNLTFTTDLAIMNGEAVDEVKVAFNKFLNPVQAVSSWRGNGWLIEHNDIVDLRTRCGGGIGILIGDYAATAGGVRNNTVRYNRVSGMLHVPAGDCGGYNGSGIVLYADFRFGSLGAVSIEDNTVTHNKVSVVVDNQGSVDPLDMVAFEMTDTRDLSGTLIICQNPVGFNDWRGTPNQIALTPDELATCNDISRNLGSNRGHGLHPSVFNPVLP